MNRIKTKAARKDSVVPVYAVVNLKIGQVVPDYAVCNVYTRPADERRAKANSERIADNARGHTLRWWKDAHYAEKNGNLAAYDIWAVIPQIEPTHNEYGELAP